MIQLIKSYASWNKKISGCPNTPKCLTICSRINVCSSLRSLLFLCERNAVLQGKTAFESCNSVFVGENNILYLGGGAPRFKPAQDGQRGRAPPGREVSHYI